MKTRRLATAALVASVATALLAPPAGAAPRDAAAAPPDTPAAHAAAWLQTQLVGGNHLETVFSGTSFPDQGLTIDAVFSFAAAGADADAARAALVWLAQPTVLSGYIGDGGAESYAGALAKTALAAIVGGEDPSAFGGVDLIARLIARQNTAGRFTDASSFGDFSNAIGQSLAILALVRDADPARAGDLTDASTYLVGQECTDGGFPQDLEKATCTSNVDATAFAVEALVAAGEPTAAQHGLDWLATQRHADGGFGSPATNANSTGLAASAFAAGERAAELQRSVAVLAHLQVGCGAVPANRGTIAFDAGGLDGRAARATSQGVPGLAGATLGDVSLAGDAATASAPAHCVIDDVYQDFLGRAGDGGGLAFYEPSLESTDPSTRASVAVRLSTSDEGARRRVAQAYLDLLGRAADAAGSAHWVATLRADQRVETVLVGLAGSSEYRTRHGGTNQGVVDGLYQDFLHRSADANGRAFWTGRLAGGASAASVAAALVRSAEAAGVAVADDYQRLLHRAPEAGALGAWVPVLVAGGRIGVEALISASAEYAAG